MGPSPRPQGPGSFAGRGLEEEGRPSCALSSSRAGVCATRRLGGVPGKTGGVFERFTVWRRVAILIPDEEAGHRAVLGHPLALFPIFSPGAGGGAGLQASPGKQAEAPAATGQAEVLGAELALAQGHLHALSETVLPGHLTGPLGLSLSHTPPQRLGSESRSPLEKPRAGPGPRSLAEMPVLQPHTSGLPPLTFLTTPVLFCR